MNGCECSTGGVSRGPCGEFIEHTRLSCQAGIGQIWSSLTGSSIVQPVARQAPHLPWIPHDMRGMCAEHVLGEVLSGFLISEDVCTMTSDI